MTIFVETERLILREMVPADAGGMFELDADQRVHTYLGNQPVQDIHQSREIICFIRQQYIDNGIGRWAVVEKATNQFTGWAGLKLIKEEINHHINFYEVGYRFILTYWGKGYATEAAKASIAYGFQELPTTVIYGMADTRNIASKKILQKTGLQYMETFDDKGIETDWFRIIKQQAE